MSGAQPVIPAYLRQRISIAPLLQDRCREHPRKPFLIFQDRSYSYKEVDDLSNRLANGFQKLGIRFKENVCIMLPNCPEFVFIWFGLCKIGAVEFPVNTAYKGDFLRYILNYSDCRFLVIHKDFLPLLQEVERELDHLESIIVVGTDEETRPSTRFRSIPYASLLEASSESPSVEIRFTDIAAILSTSGTTGPSKGVLVSYAHVYRAALTVLHCTGWGRDDIHYCCWPMFHGIAQWYHVLAALVSGATVVLAERFSASRFWQDIRHHGCTAFTFLQSPLILLLKQPPSEDDRAHQVTYAFGPGRPGPQLTEEFERRFGVKLIEQFGQTESNLVTSLPRDDRRPGSCGKPLPYYELKIVDDDDIEVPPGEVGEIVIRPLEPNTITAGYYKMPPATADNLRNCWWHTGDLGKMDSDGFLYFVDRKKDAIRRRGENISSYDVEAVVNSYPGFVESAVIAVPSELGEDDVMVVVVTAADTKPKPEDLFHHCENRMPYFAVPRYIRYRESLPKTPNGKVQKAVLRSEGVTPDTWDAERAGVRVRRR